MNRTRFQDREPTKILGREIRAELVRRNKTVVETAETIGARRATLSNKLLGHTSINVDDLFAISPVLGLTPTELVARAESQLAAPATPHEGEAA